MQLRSLFLLVPVALAAPFACSNDCEHEGGGGAGGGGGEAPDEGGEAGAASAGSKGCLFDCDDDNGGGGAGPVVDPEFANKGSLDYCTFGGIETKGSASGPLTITSFDDDQNGFTGNGLNGFLDDSSDGSGTFNIRDGWFATAPGRGDTGYATYITGSGQTTWGAGVNLFPGWQTDSETQCLYDASEFTGISFWAKGKITDVAMELSGAESEAVSFQIQIPSIMPTANSGSCEGGCWDSHKTWIELDENCWKQYVISFDDLAQTGWGTEEDFEPAFISTIGWEIKQGQDFEMWIDDIAFFTGDAPAPGADECAVGGMGGMGNP